MVDVKTSLYSDSVRVNLTMSAGQLDEAYYSINEPWKSKPQMTEFVTIQTRNEFRGLNIKTTSWKEDQTHSIR